MTSSKEDLQIARDVLVNRKTLVAVAKQYRTSTTDIRKRVMNYCMEANREAFLKIRRKRLGELREHLDSFIPEGPKEHREHPDRQMAIEVLAKRKSYQEVGQLFGLHPATVNFKVIKFCQDANPEEFRKSPWSLRWARDHSELFLPGVPVAPRRDLGKDLAEAVLVNGQSYEEAAEKFGISRGYASQKLAQYCLKENREAFHQMQGWDVNRAREHCVLFTGREPTRSPSKKLLQSKHQVTKDEQKKIATAILVKGKSYEDAALKYGLTGKTGLSVLKDFCAEANPKAFKQMGRWKLKWARRHSELFLPEEQTVRKVNRDEQIAREVLVKGKSYEASAHKHHLGSKRTAQIVKEFCSEANPRVFRKMKRWSLNWARNHSTQFIKHA